MGRQYLGSTKVARLIEDLTGEKERAGTVSGWIAQGKFGSYRTTPGGYRLISYDQVLEFLRRHNYTFVDVDKADKANGTKGARVC